MSPAAETVEAGAWYRQPVVWLGLVILLASVAGCIALMVLGARHDHDPSSAVQGGSVFGVPLHAVTAVAEEGREPLSPQPIAPAGRAQAHP
ncbi:hypothetical protein [Sterolibacterium denitrificans]|nr:hypothetical protein [Sterolibacterium denitrificans]